MSLGCEDMLEQTPRQISPDLLNGNMEWADEIVEPLDHALGHQWSSSVLPNNYLFYLRSDEKKMRSVWVGSSLHNAYEFVVSLSGQGQVCLDKQIYGIKPGDAFLVKPGQFHRYFGFNRKPFSWLFFKFDLGESEYERVASVPVCRLQDEDMGFLQETGKKYNRKELSERQRYEIAVGMGELMTKWVGRAPSAPIGSIYDTEYKGCEMLYRITYFVMENIEKPLRIKDIADHLAVSESNLRKVFREEFNVSLGAYLRTTRFGQSGALLRGTEMSISKIAQLSGFESIASFSQAYKKAFGVTPTEFRQRFLDAVALRSGRSSFGMRGIWHSPDSGVGQGKS